MTVIYYLFLFLFLFVALILCLAILVQESKNGGLGSTFGGGGGGDAGDSLFGASTPDILKKITAWLSVIFLGGCIFLSFWTGAMGRMHAKKQVSTEIIEG